MSYKVVVTKTFRWRRRTAQAEEALRPEAVRRFALRIARVHWRTTHVRSYSNLLNFAGSDLGPIDLGGSIRTLLLLGLLATIPPGVADPRLGSWTLSSAQSTLDPPNRLSITLLHDGVHVVMSGETRLDFTANRNGHESPAPGNLGFNQIAVRRIDKRTAEVTEKKDGAVVATVREKLSNDGNELTTTTTTGSQADRITVWTRSGGAKVPSDLFAGEWTQDL